MNIALKLRGLNGVGEYPVLAGIWRRSVDATHDFLDDTHRNEIESHLQTDYFPAVTITVAERDSQPVGFSGVLNGNLEMLFVDAEQRGSGVGTALLDQAIRDHDVTAVDVNEQNDQAVGFYRRHGFTVAGRSETDEAGRPYPLLHLVRDSAAHR